MMKYIDLNLLQLIFTDGGNCNEKKQKRLSAQIAFMLVALQVIIIIILSMVIYKNTVNTYLSAQNDIIEYWLDEFRYYIISDPITIWAMDYWAEHPEASKEMPEDDENVEHLRIFFRDIQADTPEETFSNLENASEEIQLTAAQFYFSDFRDIFDKSMYEKYGVSDVGCLRADDDGNIFLFHSTDLDGNVIELESANENIKNQNVNSAIQTIYSKAYDDDNMDEVLYQVESYKYEADGTNQERNLYVGYTPVVYNGEVKAVIEIVYDWNAFKVQLFNRFRNVLLILIAVCALECIYITHRIRLIAIKPLTAVQDTVYEYMLTKEGKSAHEKLSMIKPKNEISTLVTNIDQIIGAIDDYISEVETAGTRLQNLTVEVMEALASAIDAKDKYTRGHSARVAEYSKRIAEKAGKSKEACDEIYYTALLHDVGKIGIPESIINKKGRLTDEEFETIKQHPVLGAKILENIKDSPYLSIGAHYHHERYDGKGYPDHLKGEEIPEIARIVSVADAYDAMTSLRSYREPIPQQTVREELVKGSGTQFDPVFAKIMLHLIDLDIEYKMIEWGKKNNEKSVSELIIDSYRSEVSMSIHLTNTLTVTSVTVKPFDRATGVAPRPSLILFDALDGQVHSNENEIRDMVYFEYGEIWFDGSTKVSGARKMQTNTINKGSGKPDEYRIETARVKDHAMIRIIGEKQTNEVIIALPDSTRFAYISLTGEHCSISNIRIKKTDTEIKAEQIPRIAEAISYINAPEGDIPNVQVDGYRSAASQGIPIEDGMQITFHSMSLPTARLVWHCPFLNVFGADDGKVYGKNNRDYMLLRLDGECWEGSPDCTVTSTAGRTDDFVNWDEWKSRSKTGYDCTFSFERHGNIITVYTENGGVTVTATAEITDRDQPIFAAITGDQVAITNIRIKKQIG